MKKIRTITIAVMLSASLLGTATDALAQIDEPEKEETSEPAAPGLQGNTSESQEGDQMTAEEKSASDALKADKTSEYPGKKTKREKKSSDSSSADWWGIIALVVGAGGAALGVTNRKSLENIDKNNKELKASTNKTISELTGRIANLEQNLSNARQMTEKLDREIANMRKATLNTNMNSSFAPTQEAPAQHYQPAAPSSMPQQQPSQQTIKFYCGAPKDGVFTNTSRTPSNKALYVITYDGETPSKYSFADTPEGAMLAARSMTEFLEPGCVISGAKNDNFRKVKTITPGTVRRQGNGCWVIENKAVVELV